MFVVNRDSIGYDLQILSIKCKEGINLHYNNQLNKPISQL